jgi:hypothetical protein
LVFLVPIIYTRAEVDITLLVQTDLVLLVRII